MSAHRGGPECKEVFAKLSEYLDGELDAEVCEHLEGHIEDCPPCVAFLESLRRTVDLVGSLERPQLTEADREAILTAYRRLKG